MRKKAQNTPISHFIQFIILQNRPFVKSFCPLPRWQFLYCLVGHFSPGDKAAIVTFILPRLIQSIHTEEESADSINEKTEAMNNSVSVSAGNTVTDSAGGAARADLDRIEPEPTAKDL